MSLGIPRVLRRTVDEAPKKRRVTNRRENLSLQLLPNAPIRDERYPRRKDLTVLKERPQKSDTQACHLS